MAVGDCRGFANTQEAGVDEGDWVTSDGRFIYTAASSTGIQIVDTNTSTAVAEIPLPDGDHQMILDGERLVVVTLRWGDPELNIVGNESDRHNIDRGTSIVSVFDVSRPTRPIVTSQSTLEGDVVAVRSVDHTVRIVIRSGFGDHLPTVEPDSRDQAGTEKAEAHSPTTS